ncbi:MAG TPA: ankyrin repeat domain-containing protein [Schlesneria sp.]|jgi:ankyrin repeat protein
MNTLERLLELTTTCSPDELREGLRTDYENLSRDELLVAFFNAIFNRPVSVVQVFIDYGVSPNETMTSHKHSALFQAVTACRIDMIRYFIDLGADVNARDDAGMSVLHWATDVVCDSKVQAGEEDYEVIKVLLKCGANADTVDIHGSSPLLFASSVYRVQPVVDILQASLSKQAD